MKEYLLKLCPDRIHRLYGDVKFWIRFHFFRKGLISEEFKGLLGYDMDWINPKDYNQKINWQKIYGDTSMWSLFADKYLVRSYVAEKIGEQYLPKIYGVWKNADDIDFNSLPDKFVFKTNQGAGTVLPIESRKYIDNNSVKEKLNKWVNIKFGYKTIEPHYMNINPVIYAEEYLENDSKISKSLVDYKVFCFSGRPYCIMLCTDRILGQHATFSFYDTEWNPLPEASAETFRSRFVNYPKPPLLFKMLELASKLSDNQPQARIDFYIVGDRIIFGEMTMTAQGGYINYMSRDFLNCLGEMTQLG